MPLGAFFCYDYLLLIGGVSMIVVDFTKHSGKMNESILRALGSWSKSIL